MRIPRSAVRKATVLFVCVKKHMNKCEWSRKSQGRFFFTVSVCNTRTCFCRRYLTTPLVSYGIVITRAVFDTGVGLALASILNCRRFPLHQPILQRIQQGISWLPSYWLKVLIPSFISRPQLQVFGHVLRSYILVATYHVTVLSDGFSNIDFMEIYLNQGLYCSQMTSNVFVSQFLVYKNTKFYRNQSEMKHVNGTTPSHYCVFILYVAICEGTQPSPVRKVSEMQ